MVFGKQENGYNYTIQFKNIDKEIDLASNNNIMEFIKILKHQESDNLYMVVSKKNDKALKELIMSEYNLEANQVIVIVARGVMGPGGFM